MDTARAMPWLYSLASEFLCSCVFYSDCCSNPVGQVKDFPGVPAREADDGYVPLVVARKWGHNKVSVSAGSLHTANCHSEGKCETRETTKGENKEIRISRWMTCWGERQWVSDIGIWSTFDVSVNILATVFPQKLLSSLNVHPFSSPLQSDILKRRKGRKEAGH